MKGKPAFFLFGGGFLRDLGACLAPLGDVAGEMFGISPLADMQFFGEFRFLHQVLDARLEGCAADYLILDLEPAWHWLLESGGYFLSALSENQDHLQRREIAAVDPALLDRDRVMAAIDRLAQVVNQHFPAKRIILIHAHGPDYWLAGNNLRVREEKKRSNVWMEELENRFREKTGCAFVDVTKFYFLRKETGRKLTDAVFEEECYLDTVSRIGKILSGEKDCGQRPEFALSLKRYVKQYFTLQKKPQRVYLNPDHFLDRVVLCSSDRFVTEHYRELVELEKLDWSDPDLTLKQLSTQQPLTGILRAFRASEKGIYSLEDGNYAGMLAGGLVPEALLKELRANYAPKAKLLPSQINRYNAGFHFAKMRGLDPETFTTEQTVLSPRVVDVFGSCISRTAFNVQDNDFAVEHYWYHVPPFEHRNETVDYDPALFSPKPAWKERLVKLQFDGQIYQNIRKSKAEWLVTDLYFLVSPNNFLYQNCLYGDFDHKISQRLGAKKVDLFRDSSILGDREAVIRAMDPWLDLISEKYGKQIILVDAPRMDYTIGDDDRLYWVRRYTEAAFLDQAAQYVCEKTGAYRISIGDKFISDELGYMSPTPAHKEDCFYRCVHDFVAYIVDHKPEQKRFTQYPGQVHMERLRRLTKHNPPALLAAALPLSNLDQAVIRLERELLVQHFDELAALYDSCDWGLNLAEILEHHPIADNLAKALASVAVGDAPMPDAPRAYPTYPREMLRLTEPAGDCTLPAFPAVTACKALWEKAAIVLKWKAPKDASVQIYRSSGEEPWTVVGQSDEGSFTDKRVRPGKEYRYSFAVRVQCGARCYLGGFTRPVCAEVAVGVPVLTSAVHVADENFVRWAPVPGAEGYRVYRKPDLRERWQVAGLTKEPSFAEENPPGTWYTVRALKTVKGKQIAGGFQPGICAEPL